MMARSPIPIGNLPQHNTTMKHHHFFLRKSWIDGPSIQNYPPVSSNCSNGNCLQAKVSMVNYTWNILQLAMFHYQRGWNPSTNALTSLSIGGNCAVLHNYNYQMMSMIWEHYHKSPEVPNPSHHHSSLKW